MQIMKTSRHPRMSETAQYTARTRHKSFRKLLITISITAANLLKIASAWRKRFCSWVRCYSTPHVPTNAHSGFHTTLLKASKHAAAWVVNIVVSAIKNKFRSNVMIVSLQQLPRGLWPDFPFWIFTADLHRSNYWPWPHATIFSADVIHGKVWEWYVQGWAIRPWRWASRAMARWRANAKGALSPTQITLGAFYSCNYILVSNQIKRGEHDNESVVSPEMVMETEVVLT